MNYNMNYKKLLEDIRSGEFDTNKYVLVFDNDGGYWSTPNEEDDSVCDKNHEMLSQKYGLPDGYQDLVDLANAAGIPSEWC